MASRPPEVSFATALRGAQHRVARRRNLLGRFWHWLGGLFARRPALLFVPWDALRPQERRILEHSELEGKSGRALYGHLQRHVPYALAGFLNQTAALSAWRAKSNLTALDGIINVIAVDQDRIFARLQPWLISSVEREAASGETRHFSGPRHGGGHEPFTYCFRDVWAQSSQQISVAFTPQGPIADIDIDLHNPRRGKGPAIAHAIGEVTFNRLLGRKTDPVRVWKGLRKRGVRVSYVLGR